MHPHLSTLRIYSLLVILSFSTLAFGTTPAQAMQKNEVHLEQFELLTASSGWILLDQHVFWTSDTGQTWNEIGPSIPFDAVVQDVSFLDANTGWLLWTTVTSESQIVFQLAHTLDHGITWTIRSLPLFEEGEIASYAEKAEMGWFDGQTGWISVKQNSGSNFSLGTLFRTADSGETWKRFPLPVADQISFSDPQIGWAIGGPAGDQVFKTEDAGTSWQDARPNGLQPDISATAYPPFYAGGKGLLVMTSSGLENRLGIYLLDDPAGPWLLADQVALDVPPGTIGLSLLDSRNFVATIPGTTSIVQMTEGKLERIDNQDGLSASIVELDMVSLDIGWAKSAQSGCASSSHQDAETRSVSCSSETRLLQTRDGGRTWQSMHLPLVQSDVVSPDVFRSERSLVSSATAGPGNTEIFVGQGFDRCELPSISQLQTWSNSSPYKTVNLYIGGSSRACANSALSVSHIEQIYQQGWRFIPTWVGPQAPCTGFPVRFSSDITTAYNQGVDEANLAVERLAALGLTRPDKTGSVVYYDMEHYGTQDACRSAVNAFMNGWVAQLRARGNLAGVYGSTLCNTGLSDFRFIQNVPDVIWPARWYHGLGLGYYDPNASVWNLGSCVPNTVWANHQRIRQYEGDHNETWGSLTLDIDSNVLDGVVAIPNNQKPAAAALLSPSGTIHTATPTYTWNKLNISTWYYLRVNNAAGQPVFQQWYAASQICGSTTCSVTPGATLPSGSYTWSVQTWNDAGYGPWSNAKSFSVQIIPPPGAATLVSPTGAITDTTPTYIWNKVSASTWYYLWVSRVNTDGTLTTIHNKWYESPAVCSASTCSVTPAGVMLSGGSYRWWIQTWNDGGYGPWSSRMDFSLTPPPNAATLVSPDGSITATTPAYTWNKVTNSTWYYLWVSKINADGSLTTIHSQWYEASPICSGETCSITPAGVTLTSGSYRWWIQTWNDGGYGPWSSGKTFSIQ